MPTPDKGRLSLRVNFSWTFAGNAIYAACQWGYLVALARLLSPELVGKYALALAITAPVFMLTNLGLSIALATDAKDEYEFGHYLGLRLAATAAAVLIVAGSVLVGGYEWGTVRIVLLITLAKGIEAMADIFWGLFQKEERMDLSSRSKVLKGTISLAMMVALLYVFRSLEVAIVGQCVVWLLVFILWDCTHGARFTRIVPLLSKKLLASLAWLALPLGVIAGLNSLGAQLPRYFIERLHGEEVLGLFAATAALVMLARMLMNALSRSSAPRLARHFAAGELRQFKRLLARLTGLGAAVGALGVIGALLLGRWFLGFFYGPEYAGEHLTLVWIMAGAAVLTTTTFFGTGMTASRNFKVQVAIHALKIMVVAAACAVLVPLHGTLGAAWAMLVGTSVSGLSYFLVLRVVVSRAENEIDA